MPIKNVKNIKSALKMMALIWVLVTKIEIDATNSSDKTKYRLIHF